LDQIAKDSSLAMEESTKSSMVAVQGVLKDKRETGRTIVQLNSSIFLLSAKLTISVETMEEFKMFVLNLFYSNTFLTNRMCLSS